MNRTTWLQDRRMQKFRDVLSRWERRRAVDAGGWRACWGCRSGSSGAIATATRRMGLEGLLDRRLGKPSARRVPARRDRGGCWSCTGIRYRGWNVKHFHEHLLRDHNFSWGYTWVKTQLHAAGLVERAKRRGAHRRKRRAQAVRGHDAAPGRQPACLACGRADARPDRDDGRRDEHDLLGVSGRGGRHGLDLSRRCWRCSARKGLPSSLYTDRGSHYFFTPKAGEAVDKERLTQVGRALDRLGIEHIPAYSPEARGRSERMFGTLQDRLPKELKLAGIADIEAANRFIREVYLPAHNARFARPPAIAESAFVAVPIRPALPRSCASRRSGSSPATTPSPMRACRLQLPQSPAARPLRQGPRQGARVSGRHARRVPRTASAGALRRRRPDRSTAEPLKAAA